MSERIEQAVAMFTDGYSCAQSLLGVYGPLFGMERDVALRLAAQSWLHKTFIPVSKAYNVSGLRARNRAG